jgi:hypothetical protein
VIKHTIRIGPLGKLQERNLTLGKAVRYYCIECCGYNSAEVVLCPSKYCALWPYRIGRLDPAFKAMPNGDTEELEDELQSPLDPIIL